MNIYKVFGNNLKILRRQKQMTQKGLSEKVGVSGNYISMIERGLKNPSLSIINRIAQGLQVPLPELFSGPDPGNDIKKKIELLIEKSDSNTRIKILDAVKLLTS
jgi:transcriptional regulator with XRE-family HTH domain